VLAPDLFWRQKPGVQLGYGEADFTTAIGMMQKLDFSLALADLKSTVQALRTRPECSGSVASLGFCMGGLLSYLSAVSAGVDAAICYYPGSIDSHLDKASQVTCPLLIHFAQKDHYISSAAVDAVQQAFAGFEHATINVYPDVDHGFNCWERPAYHQKTSAKAHGTSLVFLANAL
jgi:carboxymethylenebutenolidase